MIPGSKSKPAHGARGRLLGIHEIASMFGVQRDTVDKWRSRKLLPEPDETLHAGPVWWETTIIRWARSTGRETGTPRHEQGIPNERRKKR